MKTQSATPFKVRQTSTGHITAEQLALVLGCIAADALVLKDMASRCCDVPPDTDSVNSYCTAIGAIAKRLAWAAAHCFADGLRIGRIVFVGLDIRLDELGAISRTV